MAEPGGIFKPRKPLACSLGFHDWEWGEYRPSSWKVKNPIKNNDDLLHWVQYIRCKQCPKVKVNYVSRYAVLDETVVNEDNRKLIYDRDKDKGIPIFGEAGRMVSRTFQRLGPNL